VAVCEFSEFSFGYALTHSITNALGTALGKAPIFPSLIQEGSVGGGYDVKIPAVPFPIFLQFKIPSVLRRSSSLRPASYTLPYYRMALRTKEPDQHKLLLNLEKSESLVFYVTPLFHEVNELDHHFVSAQVHQQSAYIKPSRIGSLDSVSHHVSYRPGELIYWLHSDSSPLKGPFRFDDFFGQIVKYRESLRSEMALMDRVVEADEIHERRRNLFSKLRNEFVELERKAVELPEPLEAYDLAPSIANSEGVEVFRSRGDIYQLDYADPRGAAMRLAFIAQVRFGLTLAFGEAASPATNN